MWMAPPVSSILKRSSGITISAMKASSLNRRRLPCVVARSIDCHRVITDAIRRFSGLASRSGMPSFSYDSMSSLVEGRFSQCDTG